MTNPYQQPQAPYQQQHDPAAPYQQPVYGYPTAPPTNTLAIVSLVSSLATFVLGITAIVGVITGHMALGQIKRTGEGGRGMAIAGLVIGYTLIGLTVLAIVFLVIAMALGILLPLAFLSGTNGDLGFA